MHKHETPRLDVERYLQAMEDDKRQGRRLMGWLIGAGSLLASAWLLGALWLGR